MTRLNELASKLTPAQLREVEDFAEFLASRDRVTARAGKRIDADGLLGLCRGMGDDKSDKELVREAWDEVIDNALKDR